MNHVPKLPFLRFDTAALPAAQRYDAWCQAVTVTHDITFPGDEPRGALVASSDIWSLGRAVVSFRRIPRQRFARGGERTRRDGLDHLSLVLMAEGQWVGEAEGRDVLIRPGQVGLFDLSRAEANEVSDSASLRVLVPRERLERVLPVGALDGPAGHGAVLGDGLGNAMGGLLAEYLRGLHRRLDDVSAAQAGLLEQATVDMVAACLAPGAEQLHRAEAQIAGVRRQRLRRHIERNLMRRELGVETICREVGVSRSVLYRLFEAEGGVQAYIQARRLVRAREALVDPVQVRRVADVAFAHGFVSEAHFSRRFRQAFGVSPREVRGMAGGAQMVAADPRYRAWVRGEA